MTSRGCPFHCTFCFKATFGKSHRQRSPENVIREMKWQMENFAVDEFHFVDDLFTLKRDWLHKFLFELEKNRFRVAWRCLARIDTLKEEDFLEMKKQGCYQVEIGIESGNNQVLKDIGKNINTKQVEKVFKWIKKAGLTTLAFFMFGHRMDTHETIIQTLSFAKKISPDACGFAVLLPFPGTQIFQSLLPDKIKFDWSLFHGYYDRNHLPISICSLSAKELQLYGQQADTEFYGRIAFLLKNVLCRRGIKAIQRKELFFRWVEYARALMKLDYGKERVFIKKSSIIINMYYWLHFVSLALLNGMVSGFVAVVRAVRMVLPAKSRSAKKV